MSYICTVMFYFERHEAEIMTIESYPQVPFSALLDNINIHEKWQWYPTSPRSKNFEDQNSTLISAWPIQEKYIAFWKVLDLGWTIGSTILFDFLQMY